MFDYHHVKIKGDGRLPSSPDTVFEFYIEMIEGREEIGKVFSIIANVDDRIYIIVMLVKIVQMPLRCLF